MGDRRLDARNVAGKEFIAGGVKANERILSSSVSTLGTLLKHPRDTYQRASYGTEPRQEAVWLGLSARRRILKFAHQDQHVRAKSDPDRDAVGLEPLNGGLCVHGRSNGHIHVERTSFINPDPLQVLSRLHPLYSPGIMSARKKVPVGIEADLG